MISQDCDIRKYMYIIYHFKKIWHIMFDKYINITSWSSKTMLNTKHIWIILTKKQHENKKQQYKKYM